MTPPFGQGRCFALGCRSTVWNGSSSITRAPAALVDRPGTLPGLGVGNLWLKGVTISWCDNLQAADINASILLAICSSALILVQCVDFSFDYLTETVLPMNAAKHGTLKQNQFRIYIYLDISTLLIERPRSAIVSLCPNNHCTWWET